MDAKLALQLVEEVKEEFLRELMQSVLKQSNFDGLISYGGIAACERVVRRLEARSGHVEQMNLPLVRAGYFPRVRKAGG